MDKVIYTHKQALYIKTLILTFQIANLYHLKNVCLRMRTLACEFVCVCCNSFMRSALYL